MISVITTFHNQKHFIEDCIGGFMSQDTKEKYEVIAVCDACDDGSAEYLRRVYPEVSVFEVDFRNAPQSRNFGRKYAKGDFILYFDGDDIPYTNLLSELHGAFDESIDFTYPRFNHPDFGLDKQRLGLATLEYDNAFARFYPMANSVLMTRASIDPEWDTNLTCCQDADRWYSLAFANRKGKHVRKVLWDYRIHDKGMWQGDGIKKDVKKMCEYIDTKHKRSHPGPMDTTLITLISRDTVLEEYIENIKQLDINRKKFSWFIYIDTDNEALVEKVKGLTNDITDFGLKRMFVTGQPNLASSSSFEERGMHISNNIKTIINNIKEIYPTPYIFMTEDDTLVEPDAYNKLINHVINNRAEIATGIEVSRSVSKHMGLCMLEEKDGEIIGRRTLKNQIGTEYVDACGWYCWVAKTDVVYNNTYTVVGHPKNLGPDVMSMYNLVRDGHRILADFSVPCKHYQPETKTWLEPKDAVGLDIKFNKEGDTWNHQTTIY